MSMALGLLLRGLNKAGVWPDHGKIKEYEGSIETFKSDIDSVVSESQAARAIECTTFDRSWFLRVLNDAEDGIEFVKIDRPNVEVPARLVDAEPCSWQAEALRYYDFEERDFLKGFHWPEGDDESDDGEDEEDNGDDEEENGDDEGENGENEGKNGDDEEGEYDEDEHEWEDEGDEDEEDYESEDSNASDHEEVVEPAEEYFDPSDDDASFHSDDDEELREVIVEGGIHAERVQVWR